MTKPKAKVELTPVEVRDRWTNELMFTAQVECPIDAPMSLKFGLAVKWGIANRARLDGARLVGARLVGANLVGARLVGANLDGARLDGARLDGARLDGANLVGANLDGANLDGARLYGKIIKRCIAIVPRLITPYVFYAWEMRNGEVWIKAGCQFRTVSDYRQHVADDYPDTPKASETLAILDYVQTRGIALGVKPEAFE